MVKVLVGKREGDRFPGFWAEFEGEKVGSYEDTRGEKSIVHTLYKCTDFNFDAYRVHVADESNPANPVYSLFPGSLEAWTKENVVAEHPMFVKDLDILQVRQLDRSPRGF